MGDVRPTELQIFGERCSGTNFVAELLRRNLPGLSRTDRYGWKHGFTWKVKDEAPSCVFVVVHRDPLDWVRSLHQKPWHCAEPLRDRSFAEFVREPWWCEWGRDMSLDEGDERLGTEMMHERDPQTGERFANVLRMRAAKLRDWRSLAGRVRHCLAVRYEDVVADPKAFVRRVAREFALRRWPWFRAVRTFKGGRDPFVKKQYPPIAEPHLAWLRSELDPEAERWAGYR